MEKPVSYTGIFLGCLLAGLVRAAFKAITGREMFKANPKGPLYKWLGGANHGSSPAPLPNRQRGREPERFS